MQSLIKTLVLSISIAYAQFAAAQSNNITFKGEIITQQDKTYAVARVLDNGEPLEGDIQVFVNGYALQAEANSPLLSLDVSELVAADEQIIFTVHSAEHNIDYFTALKNTIASRYVSTGNIPLATDRVNTCPLEPGDALMSVVSDNQAEENRGYKQFKFGKTPKRYPVNGISYLTLQTPFALPGAEKAQFTWRLSPGGWGHMLVVLAKPDGKPYYRWCGIVKAHYIMEAAHKVGKIPSNSIVYFGRAGNSDSVLDKTWYKE